LIGFKLEKNTRINSGVFFKLETLHKYFGCTEFRPLQEEIITAIL